MIGPEEHEVDFHEAERRYAELKQRLKAGGLTQEEFDKQLKQLMVQDEEGHWWVKSRTTGEWYYHDGAAWIKDTPPGYPPPQATPEGQQKIQQSQGDKPSLPPAPNRRGLYWGAGATGLAAILLPQSPLLVALGSPLSSGDQAIFPALVLIASVIIQYVATSILAYRYRIAPEWASAFVAGFYILNLLSWLRVDLTAPERNYNMLATLGILFACYLPNAVIVSSIAAKRHRQRAMVNP